MEEDFWQQKKNTQNTTNKNTTQQNTTQTQNTQAGIELGLNQAETVSLELPN